MDKDTIMDSSPELDLEGEQFKSMLASIAPKEEGVKEEVAPSPEVTKEPVEEEPSDDPTKLKAQIKGLKLELTRRSGQADKVGDLENQLQNLQGQLKVLTERPVAKDELTDAIAKLDDDGVISKQVDWQDELNTARLKYEKALESGDTDLRNESNTRLINAKRVLAALQKESIARVERKKAQADERHAEAQTISQELEDMYGAVNEVFPGFQEQGSPLWEAGNQEFLDHPKLMARMGPAGELVAAALAVIKHPEITGGKGNAAVRRDVISKIDKGLGKALSAGATSPSPVHSDYTAQVGSSQGLMDFNAMVDKYKGG